MPNNQIRYEMKEYSIQGGDEGSERLDILSRTLEKSTREFLKTAGLNKAKSCLDLGCGTGKVTMMIAEIIGGEGQVLGVDINELNIHTAGNSAKAKEIKNVSFEVFDVYEFKSRTKYDAVYSRFLLSHLASPKIILENILQLLKPGGKLFIEDTDFTGHFCYPGSDYFDQYVSLYQDLLKKRGGNANLGQSLVGLLQDMGFSNIKFQLSQPAHISGEGKLMAEITFKGISQALIEEHLITKEEFANIYSELVKYRKRNDTIISLPRIFQVSANTP